MPPPTRAEPIRFHREPGPGRLRKQGMACITTAAGASRGHPETDAPGARPWATVTTVALDEADLAARFASGDPDSVRVVYQTFGRLVFSIAFRVLRDTGLAEDATQQTFVQAWRAAGSYDPTRPLGAWLTTIAKRVAIDVHRRERRHRGHDDLDSADSSSLVTLPPSVDQLDDIAEVRGALAELSSQDRTLIRMQHFDELTHAEIASELEIPLGTVKSRSFRAHRRLAGVLIQRRTLTAPGGTDGRR